MPSSIFDPPAIDTPARNDITAIKAQIAALSTSITYRGTFQPNTQYKAGQQVTNPTGNLVAAKVDFTSGASYSATNWQDPDNAPQFRGPWAASTAYAVGDQVTYTGFLVSCLVAHTSTSTFDSTKWTNPGGGTVTLATATATGTSKLSKAPTDPANPVALGANEKGAANGVPTLTAGATVTRAQLAATIGLAELTFDQMALWAADPTELMRGATGTWTTDPTTGGYASGPLKWPDGATGTYTALTYDALGPTKYRVTHVLGGVTVTLTSGTITRDTVNGTGKPTVWPDFTVS